MTKIIDWMLINREYTPNYKTSQEISDEDTFKAMAEIYDAAFNVMLYHGADCNYLYVDNKRFSVR